MFTEWWRRVGIAYVLLYNLPGPAELIPGVSDVFEAAERWLVVLAGRRLFGLTLTIFPMGSGDTTYNYVEIVVELALAVLVATGWHLAVRGRAVSPRTRDHFTIFVRYLLGATMLGYGWAKLIPTQMPVPGPDRLLQPIGDMSPMGLLWTFMGASLPYQMFAGFAEVLGGLLLFWRRTTLLGALVLTGVLINVVALNFAFDVPVKLYSSHLLAFALLLVAPHVPRLANVLLLNRPTAPIELRPFPARRTWVRRTALVVKVGLVLYYAVAPIARSYQMAEMYGFLKPRHALAGVYRVTAFTRRRCRGRRDGRPRAALGAAGDRRRRRIPGHPARRRHDAAVPADDRRRPARVDVPGARVRRRALRLSRRGARHRHAGRNPRAGPRPRRADAAGREPAARPRLPLDQRVSVPPVILCRPRAADATATSTR